jgi:hypothetical protein
MATMILLPNGSSSVSSDWITVPVTFPTTPPEEVLDDDNGATSYVKCDDNNETMIIEYANPSIAEGNIASIDSVRFLSSGRSTHRMISSRVAFDYEVPSGNPQETAFYAATRSAFTTVNGTARPYSDGSSAAWTYSDLEALEMKCTKAQTTEVYLSYLALEVTYTEAVSADNATFFGANF